jgi:hypothetical protein
MILAGFLLKRGAYGLLGVFPALAVIVFRRTTD